MGTGMCVGAHVHIEARRWLQVLSFKGFPLLCLSFYKQANLAGLRAFRGPLFLSLIFYCWDYECRSFVVGSGDGTRLFMLSRQVLDWLSDLCSSHFSVLKQFQLLFVLVDHI